MMSQESSMNPNGRKKRVRKGTHSCRECRRRKVRCRFARPDDIVCITCSARGTPCHSQDSISPVDSPSSLQDNQDGEVINRLQRLETAVESIVGELRGSGVISASGIPTISAAGTPHTSTTSHEFRAMDDILGRRSAEETPLAAIFAIRDMLEQQFRGSAGSYQSIDMDHTRSTFSETSKRQTCKALIDLFPPHHIIKDLVAASPGSAFVSMFFHSQYEILQGNFQKPTDLAIQLPLDSHPIVFAKRLLQLVICAQRLPPDSNSLGVESRQLLKKSSINILTIVSEIVNSSDDIGVSLEGLECLLLLAIIHLNTGNLRRCWLTVRRALNMSQILGLDKGIAIHLKRLDMKTPSKYDTSPECLWHRVVFFDRYLSLVLGLPSGTGDDPYAKLSISENLMPMDLLERSHTTITGLIIERNSMKNSNEAFAFTQLIDCKLDTIAEEMGNEWWTCTSLDMMETMLQKMESVSQNLLQIHHHTLKVVLHLPHLFKGEPGTRASNARFRYSREVCATASRSILRLFIPYRNFNSSASACRHVDHSALIASLTLLLGYLAGEPPHVETSHSPETQRQEDTDLLANVQARLQFVATENEDSICGETAKVISQLMPIINTTGSMLEHGDDHPEHASQSVAPIQLHVPHIGNITIKPWVLDATGISIERSVVPGVQQSTPSQHTGSADTDWTAGPSEPNSGDDMSAQQILSDLNGVHAGSNNPFSPFHEPHATSSEFSMFPDVFADTAEWPLQGLDTTFWNLLQGDLDFDINV